uniref:Uncharacterized protein n=1 Tax=Candidatus Kentrum sp. FW TaxID=2126338 RepID=A0A450SE21_9GAMM|nr:MAG: hypothetical protein BECKFW1821B_GA0114236_100759 [Candidatus Kentron sp. FW]
MWQGSVLPFGFWIPVLNLREEFYSYFRGAPIFPAGDRCWNSNRKLIKTAKTPPVQTPPLPRKTMVKIVLDFLTYGAESGRYFRALWICRRVLGSSLCLSEGVDKMNDRDGFRTPINAGPGSRGLADQSTSGSLSTRRNASSITRIPASTRWIFSLRYRRQTLAPGCPMNSPRI